MTSSPVRDVLVVGASGSIGALAVAESIRQGHRTRALVRDPRRAATLPAEARAVIGDLARADTLTEAVAGVDAIVFTHGSHGGAADAEAVDYGAVRNVLAALGDAPTRIALMTTIGVTKHTPGHDWKRRGERLVRASGRPYTIVRPGWFDANDPDQLGLVFLQGDRRWAGSPADGVVSRRQIAQVLIMSLTSAAADRKTLELVAEHGAPPADLNPLFATLQADPADALDAVLDTDNMPLAAEPNRVRAELDAVRARRG
ncbi:SDR family oxidoreductase [Modestobacter muralis]|uniref:SDR family oxidoreductase n=1 Tax=Modestobacter muralis TaxID=1608614 RepID=A0A6P0F119_9ACTN|nr:SDR family oxidoreductase [Modestobacter muralis]NEK96396.1 SDR family oxidoreductase [Modestobacter muralis]NEN53296.1 SDR family oxidoreductase [Modestobacter muralis]